MDNSTKIAAGSLAGFAVYKAYSTGLMDDLTDKIFPSDKETPIPDFPSTIPDTPDTINIENADTVHGQPAANIPFDPEVYQFHPDTCAIQSQHLVLQQFGIDVSQEELIEIAKENGWYAEGYGTPMEMTGKLLEHFGLDIHGSVGNNIFNLANELATGHQIIVGVDAYELTPEGIGNDFVYGETPNHALVVVGIDTTDPDNVQVIVTDPGTGNRQMAYPADQFIEAWKDSDCFMVTTDQVPTHPEIPFTPLDQFGGIPVDTLSRLSSMDIDTDADDYDSFFDRFMDNPFDIDSLIAEFVDLFSFGDDDADDLTYITEG